MSRIYLNCTFEWSILFTVTKGESSKMQSCHEAYQVLLKVIRAKNKFMLKAKEKREKQTKIQNQVEQVSSIWQRKSKLINDWETDKQIHNNKDLRKRKLKILCIVHDTLAAMVIVNCLTFMTNIMQHYWQWIIMQFTIISTLYKLLKLNYIIQSLAIILVIYHHIFDEMLWIVILFLSTTDISDCDLGRLQSLLKIFWVCMY